MWLRGATRDVPCSVGLLTRARPHSAFPFHIQIRNHDRHPKQTRSGACSQTEPESGLLMSTL